MSDVNTLLLVESKKKSGFVAALLNLIIPGAGYMYCGRWFLGLVVLAIIIAVGYATRGELPVAFAGIFVLVLVTDGYLAAGRYNKLLVEEIILKQSTDESQKTEGV